jgi:bifunctional UDP-N-acetylglucosamine pyrophosphorylase/glucosamine-1-phosphate N-acetyltransferase
MAFIYGRNDIPVKPVKNSQIAVLILAAGSGTRMESELPKVLHPICGRPMLFHSLRAASALKPAAIGIVIGHQADLVKKAAGAMFKDCAISKPPQFILQKKLLGSGNAVLESLPFLKKFKSVVVLCADTPLVTYESLYSLIQNHQAHNNLATLLSAKLSNPKGYGRVIRSPLGEVLKIVEETVATPKEAAVGEINSGSYIFEVSALLEGLKEIGAKGEKKEHFLTDILEILRSKGGRVSAHLTPNSEEALGVNTRVQLAAAERIMNRRILERLMLSGVTIKDPGSVHIDCDVDVARDVVIEPFVMISGKSKIGKKTRIGAFSRLSNVEIGPECEIEMSRLDSCRILEKSEIGPFSHIRPDSVVGPKARVGNFSEVKASRIGMGSKVSHLSYIGDAEIGEDVNVGAGTITCNFDGKKKNQTVIEAGAFVGSNVNLVAPVKVGRYARIAAGSTITENVPAKALAIARERQINKV